MSAKEKINLSNIPQHIAVIMDGNGRWAKTKGKFRVFGHKHGVKSVRETAEGCAELGVKCLTLYAFSTENWSRPKHEIAALMNLLVKTIESETETLQKNKIRLDTIGDIDALPDNCRMALKKAMNETAENNHMDMVLALSYSSRWDMVNAVKKISEEIAEGKILESEIDEELISQHLSTNKWCNPELLIRTSGEQRISNFLLWELAYSELYFTEKFWPEFRKADLHNAILDYQNRERRFGKTGEQLIMEGTA